MVASPLLLMNEPLGRIVWVFIICSPLTPGVSIPHPTFPPVDQDFVTKRRNRYHNGYKFHVVFSRLFLRCLYQDCYDYHAKHECHASVSRVSEISVSSGSSPEIVEIVKLEPCHDVLKCGDRVFTTDVTAKQCHANS